MENMEKSEQSSVVLQLNGVHVDVDVITKDADLELNNNDAGKTVEKLVKISEESSAEKSVDDDDKKVDSMDANNGKEDSPSTSADDKLLECDSKGDSEVKEASTELEEKSSSSCEESVASTADKITADSVSSSPMEKAEKSSCDGSSIDESSSEAGTVKTETEGHDDNAIADADVHATDAEQQNATDQTPDDQIEPEKTADSPKKSPSKKKSSSPKKRKNRSQKKEADYSQLVNYTLNISQRQRRYFLTMPRGRNASLPTPADDCEIFVSNIPINVLEQELIPLFEKFGKIFELRLMMAMRNPKRNAGFAFVRFCTDRSATEATEKLHNYEIVPGKLLSVRLSQPNLSLFVGNIHRGLSREQIHEKLGNKTPGLVKTFVKTSLYESTKNCGFCFLEYDCHASALNAKRMLNHGNVWGRQLFVDWAQRRKQFNDTDMQESKTLFINYLPKETTEQQLTDTLGAYGAIEKVTKIKDYAFVLFTEHQPAMDAMNGVDRTKLGAETVEISLAMPKEMKHRTRFPSFSYREPRFNRRHNSYNRHRPSFGSTGNFFMQKQHKIQAQPNTTNTDNNMDASTSAAAAGTSDGQTVIPSIVINQAAPIAV